MDVFTLIRVIIVIIFALFSPYISTFPKLLKFTMPVMICLSYCTFDKDVYLEYLISLL